MLTKSVVRSLLAVENTIGLEEVKDILGPSNQPLVDAICQMARPAKSKDPATISAHELAQGLFNQPVSAFATIGFLTTPGDSKLVKPKSTTFRGKRISGLFQTLGVSQVIVNANYANMVNNAMGRECEPGETIDGKYGAAFEPAAPAWYDRIYRTIDGKQKSTGLGRHRQTGQLYVVTALLRSIGSPTYFFDGDPVEWSEVKHLFHPKRASKRQPLPEDKQIQWRTWKFESIQTLCITPNTEPRLTHRLHVSH
jgi:hypothetical protein